MTRIRVTAACAIVNESIAPNAYRLPRNVAWPGISAIAAIVLKMTIPTHGVRTGMEPAQAVGHLAVNPHRVGQPRHAEDPGVRGDEQDRRREQPDVDLGRVL